MADEIEAVEAVVDHPAKRAAAADAASPGEVSGAEVGTVRIAGVRRSRMAAEAVGIDPAAAPLRPNAAVPSSWSRLAAAERSAPASVVTAAAFQVVEEDAQPWTSAGEEAEECSRVEIRLRVVAVRAAEADGPSVVPVSTVVAEEGRPFHDA